MHIQENSSIRESGTDFGPGKGDGLDEYSPKYCGVSEDEFDRISLREKKKKKKWAKPGIEHRTPGNYCSRVSEPVGQRRKTT